MNSSGLFKLRKDESALVLNELDDKSLFNYCLTNKSLCPGEEFWRNRFIRKYGKVASEFKNVDRTWKNYYLLAVHYDEKYTPGRALEEVSEKGYFDLIQFFIFKGGHKEQGLRGAAKGGHKELVNFFLEKGMKFLSYGVSGAAEGGNMDLINFLISKRANDWEDQGLIGAAKGGHKKLVDFFISEGAYSWNYALEAAAEGGHRDLIDFFILKGANLNLGLRGAAKGGHKDLIDFFIAKGANSWQDALSYAAEGGQKEFVDFFIAKGANNLMDGLWFAKHGGHKEMIKFFEDKLNA